ncbi:MAG: Rpn family recombination-promoting nuclease/putative transposase [Moorea sp. SIO3I7]|uniref:Rpn family recombination-promoting nuclease/putative transposase n=1 Tax=unclassified Moorena TaxID=2683338 RepID=UPI0013BFA72D|nr:MULTISPECIES: Rpn family recombination-promoting nuclease/putative transposase [unclassified Moorena]NEN99199.1 Rpn family recombination-promoting nuclease/putative transposase [Moorena sp. SIO3I7]NEO06758.1 Rpn family recombination-promoting nuclease/putative transposase [Moorena sp. SIO3I8]NEO20924.1 Rpn family recombination-promoting nuclease/putative transposase [Moorena sp. SIO4A5]NEP27276.1 Rpn family recombination-promoting nuclease/putative transposase [Moorena sp. SIO3I6]NEQ61041.1
MRFISPKTDFAFKKIFGSDQSKDILISFLNAMIYSGESVIQDLEILDPYSAGDVVELKDTVLMQSLMGETPKTALHRYLDVKAVLEDQTTVLIEMQIWNVEAFEKRVVYNLCKTYGNQLKSGQGYFDLNPVIALTITDFKLFPSTEKVISCFYFQEKEEHLPYQENELAMVFVELPKFTKQLEELESVIDKWIYFIKEAPSLEIIPENLREIPQLEKALTIANQAGLSVSELEKLRKQEMVLEDTRGALSLAQREGIEQGIIQGIEQGIIQGRVQGERRVIVRQLERRFGQLSSNAIALIEALTNQELERLSEAIWDFQTREDLLNWLQQNSN